MHLGEIVDLIEGQGVLSSSQTAVAFGISGALLMANLLCASPTSLEAKPSVISDDGNSAYISMRGKRRNA